MVDFRFSKNVIVMVKAPVAGLVKTRLASSIGSIEAVRFYRSVMSRVVNRVSRDHRWRTYLAIAPDSYLRERIFPIGPIRISQGRGNLGQRMQRLFELPNRGPTIIIGSDVPDINAAHIAGAFSLLKRNDVVFGPTDDGGFWLVGLKRTLSVPRIFSNVRWSTEHALADTCENIDQRIGFAAQLSDVDTDIDWYRWRRRR
jgi:rSAM/selenodomain-associated transferase 1